MPAAFACTEYSRIESRNSPDESEPAAKPFTIWSKIILASTPNSFDAAFAALNTSL